MFIQDRERRKREANLNNFFFPFFCFFFAEKGEAGALGARIALWSCLMTFLALGLRGLK